MKKPWQWPGIAPLILLEIGLLSIPGSALPREQYRSPEYSTKAVELPFLQESGSSRSGGDTLQRFKKGGKFCLTLKDCLDIALERNHDIRLIKESLDQAETEITRAWSAMFPFLGAKASHTRFDEKLAFSLGLTFMERDIYNAGIVIRQPIFMGGRLNAARKAAECSRNARAEHIAPSVRALKIFDITQIAATKTL